ncbi:hypothetical protein POM88_017259 [Heracleum sosnowskyi]|uniref:Uncharacterized protein n=1 Tax=Heracleum sosnowskyi TaxID=360622 RepID=A0AAD8IQH4_9APIA|nr:hypothetical protein POM88_017259 [Heracleum sosnowskyi]
MILFGAVDLKKGSVTEKIKELRAKEDATIQIAQKKLFENSQLKHFIHMDLGMELDVYHLKKVSVDYEAGKKLALDTVNNEPGNSQHHDDNNYQPDEDGTDDELAMELEQALAHNGGDSEE